MKTKSKFSFVKVCGKEVGLLYTIMKMFSCAVSHFTSLPTGTEMADRRMDIVFLLN